MNKFSKILYIMSIILVASTSCKNGDYKLVPVVQKGVINLKNWDFIKDGNIKLDGEWEFYWNELLTFEEIKEKKRSVGYLNVPGNWNNYKYHNKKIGSYGYGTYRVKILLPGGEKKLGIKILSTSSAAAVFINNKLVHTQGKVGINKSLSVPYHKTGIIRYVTNDNEINITVQLSNYHHAQGGIWNTIMIGEEKKVERSHHFQIIYDFFLFGSILIMAFYHLFLYSLRTNYKATLYFSIFCILNAMRILLTGEKFLFTYFDLNWTFLIKLEYLTYYIGLMIFVLFIYYLFPKETHKKVIYLYNVIASIFCFIVIFAPVPILTNSLKLYNIISVLIGIYIFYILTIAIIHKRDGALILLSGYIFIFLTATNDLLHHQQMINTALIFPMGVFIFIFAQAGSISIQFSKTFKVVERLTGELKIKINDFEKANKQIKLSENKYKLLVEGTNDIIFTMDENWNFLSVNKSIQRHLNITTERTGNLNFLDLIFEESDNKTTNREVVKEKLEQLTLENNEIYFKTNFISPISSEPREMAVSLEYIQVEGKNEILGKLSRILEDDLLKYFLSERQNFAIENYLIICADISQRLTRNIEKYIPKKEIKFIQLALREMIINSIEHGNLNISFEEKNKALMNDHYMEFISKRQRDPLYKNKKVTINYSIDEKELVYVIKDEGNGFDHNKFTENQINDINNEMITHGRGIAMTMKVFDSVEYNEKGNQVTLRKKIT